MNVKMAYEEMPIFAKTFDLLMWLLPATDKFPRAHRFTLTKRMLDAAFELRERLEEAQYRSGKERLERLARADEALAHAAHGDTPRLRRQLLAQHKI